MRDREACCHNTSSALGVQQIAVGVIHAKTPAGRAIRTLHKFSNLPYYGIPLVNGDCRADDRWTVFSF